MRYTNKYLLPQSIVDSVTKETYDLAGTERIGVTTLINPPRIQVLKERYSSELEEDVSDNIWRLLGSAVHDVLSRITEKDRLVEERMEQIIDGVIISGKPDLFDLNTKCVEDFKVTSVWSYIYNPEGKKEWVEQLNCYAWLLRRHGIEVDSLMITMLLRDWSRTDALRKIDYPEIPIKTIAVDLWDFEKQTEFVYERVQKLKSNRLKKDKDLDLCTPEERWKKETTYAVFTGTNKRATKVFAENELEKAENFAEGIREAGKSTRIEERPGVDNRCKDYCSVCNHCDYYLNNYKGVE